jgi:hypothetical protein
MPSVKKTIQTVFWDYTVVLIRDSPHCGGTVWALLQDTGEVIAGHLSSVVWVAATNHHHHSAQ